jgi:hypothetical protein
LGDDLWESGFIGSRDLLHDFGAALTAGLDLSKGKWLVARLIKHVEDLNSKFML